MITRRLVLASLGVASAFPARATPNKGAVITLLGDSITAGLGLPLADTLPKRLQDALAKRGLKAIVRGAGVSGDTTAGALARLDFSVQRDTTLCIVELGGNDFLQSVDPIQVQDNLAQIAGRLRARGIKVLIAAGHAPKGSSGSYGRSFDKAFKDAALKTGAVLLPDFLDEVLSYPGLRQADGIHPNAKGVDSLVSRLTPSVIRILGNKT